MSHCRLPSEETSSVSTAPYDEHLSRVKGGTKYDKGLKAHNNKRLTSGSCHSPVRNSGLRFDSSTAEGISQVVTRRTATGENGRNVHPSISPDVSNSNEMARNDPKAVRYRRNQQNFCTFAALWRLRSTLRTIFCWGASVLFSRCNRFLLIIILTLLLIIVLCFVTVVIGLFAEVASLCASPSSPSLLFGHPKGHHISQSKSSPLVEYYIHGRGNGHYARSVAIIEQLNEAGVDVRMYISRSTMWRALNQQKAQKQSFQANENGPASESAGENDDDSAIAGAVVSGGGSNALGKRRGITTAIPVIFTVPNLSAIAQLSIVVERVHSNCEVSQLTGRYPDLVITDGDAPGVFRGFFGSIPTVAISHGQTFVIAEKPNWVTRDRELLAAWKNQAWLNRLSAILADWQIATNFLPLTSTKDTGIVASSPMRPEVKYMSLERKQRKRRARIQNQQGTLTNLPPMESFLTKLQKRDISNLLLVRGNDKEQSTSAIPIKRRRLVICYFRDKNGDLLTMALLKSGFDVLLFERGYHKGFEEEENFGKKWVVQLDDEYNSDKENPEKRQEKSLNERWANLAESQHLELLVKSDNEGRDQEAEMKRNHQRRLSQFNEREMTSQDHNNRNHRRNTALTSVGDPLESPPRIIRVTDMTLFVPLMSVADAVASSAGSQLMSECIFSDVPIFALYKEGDDEQRLNLEMSRRRFLDKNGKETRRSEATRGLVHGMSLEQFSTAFSPLLSTDASSSSVEFPLAIEQISEQAKHNGKATKFAYEEFNGFVRSVRDSVISSSYYHDLNNTISTGVNGTTAKAKPGSENKIIETGEGEGNDEDDPFGGMPDAASVIMEIINQVTAKKS